MSLRTLLILLAGMVLGGNLAVILMVLAGTREEERKEKEKNE